MVLNVEGHLGGDGVAVEGISVTLHDTEGGGGGSRKVEEAGHAGLDEVMGVVAVHQNHNTVAIDGTEEAEGLRCRGSLHRIETDLGN